MFAVVGLPNNSQPQGHKDAGGRRSRVESDSPTVIIKLQIGEDELEITDTFQGVNPGRSHPKGKITLPVTFGGELNYRTERIVFDVVDLPLPYNAIPGCPALAKFMAASHYAYNTWKMPGHWESSLSHQMRRMQLSTWTRCTGM